MIIVPGNPLHRPPPFRVKVLPFSVMCLAVMPPTVIVAPVDMFVPTTVRISLPAALLASEQLVTPGTGVLHVGGGGTSPAQVTVTMIPCSLPLVHVPLGALRFRLVPFGPLTKIKNVSPAFCEPKLNTASISVGDRIAKLVASITCPVR